VFAGNPGQAANRAALHQTNGAHRRFWLFPEKFHLGEYFDACRLIAGMRWTDHLISPKLDDQIGFNDIVEAGAKAILAGASDCDAGVRRV
jgi:hypothetical protein